MTDNPSLADLDSHIDIAKRTRLKLVGFMYDWYSGGRGFDPTVRQHFFVRTGHGIISTAIISLPQIQVG